MPPTSLRVLHLIDTGGPGGAETILLNLVKGLEGKVDDQVVVVPEEHWLSSALRAAGTEPIIRRARSGGYDVGYATWLWRTIRSCSADLIQAHLLGSATYASLVGSIARTPVICTFHGTPDFGHPSALLDAKLRIFAREPNRIICVSDRLRQFVEEALGIPSRLCATIHNGVEFPDKSGPRKEARIELGAPRGELLVGAVGNVRPPKDYPNLIRAIALLHARGIVARLAIIGQAPPAALRELQALANDLGVGTFVRFLGFRSDAMDLLAACDIFVCSSSTEGFSLATVEAMSVAIPVVATRSGGPEEIIADGETGLLVPPSNSGALASAIAKLWGDQRLSRRLAKAGARHARANFSVDRMVQAYFTLYRQVRDNGRPTDHRGPPPFVRR